jgi:hypothetical protein
MTKAKNTGRQIRKTLNIDSTWKETIDLFLTIILHPLLIVNFFTSSFELNYGNKNNDTE